MCRLALHGTTSFIASDHVTLLYRTAPRCAEAWRILGRLCSADGSNGSDKAVAPCHRAARLAVSLRDGFGDLRMRARLTRFHIFINWHREAPCKFLDVPSQNYDLSPYLLTYIFRWPQNCSMSPHCEHSCQFSTCCKGISRHLQKQ